MENATKAVVIAGEVLVGVLILTLIVVFFNRGNSINEEFNSNMDAQELAAFNAKFEEYNRENLSYDDIISVANMAYDYNKQSSFDENNSITIKFLSETYVIDSTVTKKGEFGDGTNFYNVTSAGGDKLIGTKSSYKCTACEYNGKTGKVSLMMFDMVCSHDKTTSIVTENATCENSGKTEVRCKLCNKLLNTLNTPGALGHELKKVVTEATCTSNGMIDTYCERTGCTYHPEPIITEATGHNLEWSVKTASTCIKKGLEEGKCKNTGCTYSETKELALADHDWGEFEVTNEATCTETGSKVRKCKLCGATKDNTTIAALGHSWGEKKVTKAATCTTNGEKARVCTRCNSAKTDVETINKLGHNLNWKVEKVATCTVPGSKKGSCQNPGCTYSETKSISATGHSWGAYQTTVTATCLVSGQRKRTCSVCGESQTESTGKSDHNWDITKEYLIHPTCTSGGWVDRKCKVCGTTEKKKYLSKLGHNYVVFHSEKQPTCTTNGYKKWKCSRCNSINKNVIKKLGHLYDETEPVTVIDIIKAPEGGSWFMDLLKKFVEWFEYMVGDLKFQVRYCTRNGCGHYKICEIVYVNQHIQDIIDIFTGNR